MTDVRERVARAVYAFENNVDGDSAWAVLTDGGKAFLLQKADAALSAIGYEEIVGALEKAQWYVHNFPSSSIPDDKPFVEDIDLIDAALRKARGEP